MLRTWAEAWQANAERRADQAAATLLDQAESLLTAQHPYFAGMIAHCVARMGRRVPEAATLIRSASQLSSGGLLQIFARHADAVAANDIDTLESIAADAGELGLVTTAADTWLWLSDFADRRKLPETQSRRHLVAADKARALMPAMALWNAPPDRSTLLTGREHRVVQLAVDRLTAKEIAELDSVSVNTVTNQLASAFRKLGVSSRGELRDLLGPH